MFLDHIVLATDFSPASSAALAIAAKLARLFKIRIVAVHVFQYAAPHRYQVPVEWMIQIIRDDVDSKIGAIKASLNEMGVASDTQVIEAGAPPEEILRVARSYKAPLIVMGTHAFGGADRFLLGSTAETVLREAPCPVVTVGPHVRSVTTPAMQRTHLVYATDFTREAEKAIPLIAMFLEASETSLRVVHVQTDPDADRSFDEPRFDSLKKRLDGLGKGLEWNAEWITLHGKHVSQAITNEAERQPTDFVVLGVHGASAFISHLAPKTAYQIITAAPCAVLTIASS